MNTKKTLRLFGGLAVLAIVIYAIANAGRFTSSRCDLAKTSGCDSKIDNSSEQWNERDAQIVANNEIIAQLQKENEQLKQEQQAIKNEADLARYYMGLSETKSQK